MGLQPPGSFIDQLPQAVGSFVENQIDIDPDAIDAEYRSNPDNDSAHDQQEFNVDFSNLGGQHDQLVQPTLEGRKTANCATSFQDLHINSP